MTCGCYGEKKGMKMILFRHHAIFIILKKGK